MESAQRELVSVLLDHICSLGLISNSTYSKAMDLVHSATDLPEFLAKEADGHECASGTP